MYSSEARYGWLRMLFAVAVVLGLCGGLAGKTDAAIYWANGESISRMNLDGTNPSPGMVKDEVGACGLAVDGSHIFWADKFDDRIGRADLDGSNRENAFITGADEPCGVAVDAEHVYWANEGGNSIGRAGLDGAEVEQNFVASVTRPCGIAVNSDFIYWASSGTVGYVGRALRVGGDRGPNVAEFGSSLDYALCGVAADEDYVYWGGFGDAIGRVGADGSDPEPRFMTGLQSPCSLAIGDGKLYLGEISQWNGNGHLSRANLDGTGMEREITGATYPCGIAVDSLAFGPSYVAVPPLLQWTPCSIEDVRVNKRNGSALVRLDGPAYGDFGVTSKGVAWRILSKRPPAGGPVQASWHWWLRVGLRAKGRVAHGLRRRLARNGRAPLELRVSCSEDGRVANHDARRVVLRSAVNHKHTATAAGTHFTG